MSVLSKIFPDANKRYIRKIEPLVKEINSQEQDLKKLSDKELKEKTQKLKERLASGGTLNEILPEAFALAREASERTLKQRHFDVQLMGGIALHQGKIAEMKTGEGKTLAATLPVYLNALEEKGVHIVTVNDYLARRDAVWMGQIYNALGLSVGCITHEQAYLYDATYQPGNLKSQISNLKSPSSPADGLNLKNLDTKDEERDLLGGFKVVEDFLRPVARKEAYQADITYGTNNEFGFDFLRDNMAYDLAEQVQRPARIGYAEGVAGGGFNFAIVDEIDSILIDEARTPLIISSPGEESTDKYYQFAKLISILKPEEDYKIDEKLKTATFTEKGQNRIIGELKSDPWAENDISTTHQLESALRARTLFIKDRDYVVKPARNASHSDAGGDGQVIIVDEFTGRLMPGRRWSAGLHQAVEAKEGVRVQQESKTWATITFQNYFRMYKKLAGMTGTAETSAEEFDKVYKLEVISVPTNKPMIRRNLPDRIYKTINGKFLAILKEIKERHEKGQPVLVGTVSIDKNEFLGKLLEREGIPFHILNAKNHEKEGEIIAQAGKFKAVTIATNMAGRGVDIILGGNPQNPDEAQKVRDLGGLHIMGTDRHEARRIDNQLRGRAGRQGDPGSSQFFVSLEDDLMRIFGGDKIKSLMEFMKMPEDQPIEAGMVSKAIESAQAGVEGMNFDLRKHILEYDEVMSKHREVFYKKRKEILEKSSRETGSRFAGQSLTADGQNNLKKYVLEIVKNAGFTEEDYNKKEKELGEENMRKVEKFVCLRVLDTFWIEHLEDMDHLRDSVRLRAYAQQDPLVEYKTEGHQMFRRFLDSVDVAIADAIFKAELTNKNKKAVQVHHHSAGGDYNNVGRNDPCPCGSGKKYKRCHGA